jgi:hypothetical protein
MMPIKFELCGFYLCTEKLGYPNAHRFTTFWVELFAINDSALFMVEYDMGNWKFDLLWLRKFWFMFCDWRENRDD